MGLWVAAKKWIVQLVLKSPDSMLFLVSVARIAVWPVESRIAVITESAVTVLFSRRLRPPIIRTVRGTLSRRYVNEQIVLLRNKRKMAELRLSKLEYSEIVVFGLFCIMLFSLYVWLTPPPLILRHVLTLAFFSLIYYC
jgi:hypothetical protein